MDTVIFTLEHLLDEKENDIERLTIENNALKIRLENEEKEYELVRTGFNQLDKELEKAENEIIRLQQENEKLKKDAEGFILVEMVGI